MRNVAGTSSRERHPSHLRGRDIGLFYRNRNQGKKQREEEIKKVSDLKVPEHLLDKIRHKLDAFTGMTNEIEEVNREFEKHFESVLKTDFDSFVQNSRAVVNLKDSEPESTLDLFFAEQLKEKRSDGIYKERLAKREALPVHDFKDEILKGISESNVILISGDTGCGKTTQVPQFILDEMIDKMQGSSCNIVCTQPRRISAITISERVAWERCEKLGISVGYTIRMES